MKYTTKNTLTLLETVMEIYHGVSKQKAKQILSHSVIIVDGKKVEKHPKLVVNVGSEVELLNYENQKKEEHFVPNRRKPISIYFEDDNLLVALKPPGILSCSDREQKNTKSFHKLIEQFIFMRDEKKLRIWPVHRLDKEVEGLILFAKSEEIQEEIKENWEQVTKKYLALVENKPEQNDGFIENWLKEGIEQKAVIFKKEVEGSKFAKTEYHYLKKEKDYHLIELVLHTGRKNQIRAHLSGIGCPIVGDRKYGADDSVKRQVRLAAYKIEFVHPVSGQKILLEYQPIKRFFNPSKEEDENYKII